jgi:hypothetical protein
MSRWTTDLSMRGNKIKLEHCPNGWSLELRRIEHASGGGCRTVKESHLDEDLGKLLRYAQIFFEEM